MRIVEATSCELRNETHAEVTKFDLNHDAAIFDVIPMYLERHEEQSESETESITAAAENSPAENKLATDINMNDVTCYPNLRRSERRTADKPFDRLGHEIPFMVVEPSDDSKIPMTYKEAITFGNNATWKKSMEKKIES